MARATTARLGLLVCGVMATAYGCSDLAPPTAPAAHAPRFELYSVEPSTPVTAKVLRRNVALPSDIMVTQTISPSGGTIKIDKAGLTVVFSKGALPWRTAITVTAHAGDLVTYTFAPHGLAFRNSVTISQRLRYTIAEADTDVTTLEGGYLANGLTDIDTNGVALVAETYPVEISSEMDVDGQGKRAVAKFSVSHFSGYMLASGRKEVDSTTTKVLK